MEPRLPVDSRKARHGTTSQKRPSILCLIRHASRYAKLPVTQLITALGLMSLQLLNLGPLFSLGWARIFARTPRGMFPTSALLTKDHAEANAPPMINYGWVYPQALLIFTITLVYSVVSPLILVFGAIYFGIACELRVAEITT
jgi:hypothetical protein